MTEYVECDNCYKPIFFGQKFYQPKGRCGIYCSGECYAKNYADTVVLTKEEAEDCMFRIKKKKF